MASALGVVEEHLTNPWQTLYQNTTEHDEVVP